MTRLDPARMRHVNRPAKGGAAHATVLSPDDFARAVAEITAWPGYAPTPLYRLDALAGSLGIGGVLYKNEGPRFGLGSFKALGGAYAAARLLSRELSKRLGRDITPADLRSGALASDAAKITLASATDGNHGRSLAWGARMFGAPCRIYVHRDVSPGRIAAMEGYGATVTVVDGDYDASVRRTREDADANGWFVVSDTSWEGYTDPPRDVMAGYGVMAREIADALATPPSHVLLQGGVGGLAAAIAAAFRQHWGANAPRVVIVEPDLAPCLFASARAGAATPVEIHEETVMAGLSCGEPSALAWEILAEEARDFVTIPDDFVGPTMRLLARPEGGDAAIAAGESAVAGLAALIAAAGDADWQGKLDLGPDSVALVIGSEGVTDRAIYARIMAGAAR
ncbi:diaminopropionate ammonia-lyase [Defluviimonas sp. SAOS-178_SWC]|uniref:diaminopropionate ammonia-lyase n=1 Tax=Defluviimonas sp. SAOS-178_SWC TaxID=3121287 RepID=UPI003221E186